MRSLRIFFTSRDWDFVSWRIRAATGGRYSHCGLLFHEDGQSDYYFESLSKVDKVTGKNGVRGPKLWSSLVDWEAESKWHHLAVSEPLPFDPPEVDGVERRVTQAVGKIGYAYLHCIEDLVAVRTGFCVTRARHLQEKDMEWNCSETVARCMPLSLWPTLGYPDTIADWIVPAGKNLPSIETFCRKMQCNITVISGAVVT